MVEYTFNTTTQLIKDSGEVKKLNTKWHCMYVEDIVGVETLIDNNGRMYKTKCLITHKDYGKVVINMTLDKTIKKIKEIKTIKIKPVGYGHI